MITAIVGKAGAGKTTIAKILASQYDHFWEADQVVKEAYQNPHTLQFFAEHAVLSRALLDGQISKSALIQLLLQDPAVKLELEDHLFATYFLPQLQNCRSHGLSFLVDGIVARFLHHFDQVITVEATEEVRRSNLRKRGVPESRIQELIQLQR